MAVNLWIDIENGVGQRQGSGPITSASRWRYTARMDKAGQFEFEMPASDSKAISVRRKYIARAYAYLNGQRIEVGAGIIDRIAKQPQADGTVVLRVSGDDLIRELTYRSVLKLKLYNGGNPVTHAEALTATSAYAPVGWTFTPDGSPPNDSIYGYFNGETVLAAMIKIAEKSQNHFYRGSGRSLVFESEFTPSGVRAIQARGELSPATCAIVSLTEQIDTYDLITRTYPRGSGNAEVQLTLRATNRVAPAGYTLNATSNYIENDTATATYGLIERQVDFRDIGPIDNTDADIQAASNMLFDAALEYLRRNSTELEQETYTLSVESCSQLLRPMQSIRVVYRNTRAGLDIDTALNILEATWQVDASGIYTTDLVVSNADRWPKTDVGTIVDNIAEGHVYQALPQLNANSYVTAYNKNLDLNNSATFRFRFGDEVTQLQQVLFEFQLLPFESTVKSIGTETGGSGEVETSGPSIDATGTGGNNETGIGGPTSTDSATPSIGSATPDIGNATPDIGTATPTIGQVTPTIGGASPAIGASTPNIGNATPTIGTVTPTIGTVTPTIGNTTPSIGSSSPNTGSTALTTNTPTGGATDGSGDHQHAINVIPGAGNLGEVSLHLSGGFYFLACGLLAGTEQVGVTPIGFHTHTVTTHTHTITAHTHTTDSHNHTIAGHNHTMTAHTHSIAAHSHTIASHDHTIAAHTHTIAAHTHTISAHAHEITAHSHTIASHNHTIAVHTHTITAHTHSMAQHTHSLNNHTHSLEGGIEAVYGIFREEPENTFEIDVLEYRVNGGSWADLSGATDVGDGWYQLDITNLVMDSTTFRPLQASNLLEIQSVWFGVGVPPTGVTIDAQLSVRNIIQAIAYVE